MTLTWTITEDTVTATLAGTTATWTLTELGASAVLSNGALAEWTITEDGATSELSAGASVTWTVDESHTTATVTGETITVNITTPATGGSGAVSSVFTRTGAVVAATGDYTAAQITETTARVFVTPTEKTAIGTATQPGDLGTAAAQNVEAFATGAEGDLATSATQPGDLGGAAVLDVGTTTGTVAAGDDSRIVDGGTALQPAGDGSSLTDLTHGQLGGVGASDHHAKYLDSEAVAAMGASDDTNPLNHDRPTGALADLDTVGATEIVDDAVTNAKLANVATATIKGRTTAATGSPEDLTATQARAVLNVEDGAEANNISDANAATLTGGVASDADSLHTHAALDKSSLLDWMAYNICALALEVADLQAVAIFSLVDIWVDDFQNATGIDSGNTDWLYDAAGNYYTTESADGNYTDVILNWRMEVEGVDDSGNGHTWAFTYVGSSLATTAPVPQGLKFAYWLKGLYGGRIESDADVFTGLHDDDLSVLFWFKDNMTNNWRFKRMLSASYNKYISVAYLCQTDYERIVVYLHGETTGDVAVTFSSSTYDDFLEDFIDGTGYGAWAHFGVVYTQATATITLVVDGVLVATLASGLGAGEALGDAAYSSELWIGQEVSGGDATTYVNAGWCDDVAIYACALSVADIAKYMDRGAGAASYGIASGDLISETFVLSGNPTGGYWSAHLYKIDPTTLNTDLLIYLSCDGGSNWEEATLVEWGTPSGGAGYAVITASHTFTQSDTDLCWKLVMANEKQMRLYRATVGAY